MTRSRLAFTTLALVGLLGLAAGCSVSGGDGADASLPDDTTTSSTSTTVAEEPDEPDGDDDFFDESDCPDAEDIAAIVGITLERSVHFGGNFASDISTSSTGCSYAPAGSDNSDDDSQVTIARITTDAPLRERLFDTLDQAKASEADENRFEPIDDLGDDAYLDGRQVVMKVGDAMVFVDYVPGDDTELGDENPAIPLAEDVVDAGLSPDDAPDCEGLTSVVADRFGDVTGSTPESGFIGLDDISITTSGCSFELDDGTEVGISVASADPWDGWVAAMSDSVFTTSYEPLEVNGLLAFDDGEVLVVEDGSEGPGDSPHEIGAQGFDLDDGEAAALRLEIAETVVDD